MRARLHCGYMPPDQWVGDKPQFDRPYIGGDTPDVQVPIGHLSVCPGWLVRQPAVIQVAKAAAAYEKGLLAEYFPAKQAAILDGAMLLSRSLNGYQSYQMSKDK